MLVEITASATLIIATIVWLLWRIYLWRRNGGNLSREFGIAVLFLVSLLMVRVTLFPLKIIFYDWRSVISLVPFASITQLIRYTATITAVENIVGNILLFMPIGLLLPLLFNRIRRFGAFIWRAAVISVAIEATQLFSRARTVDIDDVILNTTGAALGFVMYLAGAAIAKRSTNGSMLLDRLGQAPHREPLLAAAVPIALTVLISLPLMLSTIVDGTLNSDATVALALENSPGSTVVAQASFEEQSFVLVKDDSGDDAQILRYDFEKVLPGRFTWLGWSQLSAGDRSRYTWNITPFNTAKNELPKILLWGINRSEAAAATMSGNGIVETLSLPPETYFVVGFTWDIYAYEAVAPTELLQDFAVTFTTADGIDVTDQFISER